MGSSYVIGIGSCSVLPDQRTANYEKLGLQESGLWRNDASDGR